MNKQIVGALGLVIGAGIGAVVTYNYMREESKKRMDSYFDSMKDYYSKKIEKEEVKRNKKIPKKDKEELYSKIEDLKQDEELVSYDSIYPKKEQNKKVPEKENKKSNKTKKENEKVPEKENKKSNKTKKENEKTKKKNKKTEKKDIYPISFKEFGDDGYAKKDLIMYSDGVVTDAKDKIISDKKLQELLDIDNLTIPKKENEMYIRNEITKTDYGISLENGTYDDVVGYEKEL